jgi:cytochrome subunit of sulfide dehydrogenase
MKRRPASLYLLLGSLLSLVSFTVGAQPLVSPHLARNLAAQCANCHGTNGKSVAEVPSLAGQPAAVFVQKMQDYRAGKLPASIMHQLSKGYTDEQVALMADFFSKQTSQPK